MSSRPIVVGAYPVAAQYIIKFIQNLAAGAVSGVLFYFIISVNKGQAMPWLYYLLQAAALGTLVTNIVSQIVACVRGANPILNTIFSAIFFIVWGVGTGLLIRDMRVSITLDCKILRNDTLVTQCNLMRVVFIATIVAMAFTLFSLILDIIAWKRYRRMQRNGHTQVGYAAKGTGSTQYMPVHSGSGNNNGTSYQPQALYPQSYYPQAAYQANAPYDPQNAYQSQQYGR